DLDKPWLVCNAKRDLGVVCLQAGSTSGRRSLAPRPEVDVVSARHLIIGAGEVGTALRQVLAASGPCEIRDVEPVEAQVDVLHIAFPWSATFVEHVHAYRAQHGADLVIVHSTVPVGTCDEHGWVHSPVRGRHPRLAPGLRVFVKHFGGVRASEAAYHWPGWTRVHPYARDTAAGKLWELIQYGVQIQAEKAIHAWCPANGVDPEIADTEFAETYNDGYRRLNEPQFVRPVLEHVPGPIGGHCVVQNARLLDHPLARIVTDGLP